MNSGQRSRIGFIGSIVTHIFILLFVSFVGLFNLSHPPANDIVEVSPVSYTHLTLPTN